jgi:predicted nucleotidyltransferase
MACMWIEQYNEVPPMEFGTLLNQIQDKELHEKINELLLRKKAGVELSVEPRISIINNFIEKMLQHFKDTVVSFDPRTKPDHNFLEEEFINIIEHCK